MRAPRTRARLDTCPRCQAAIIVALDDTIAARRVHADPLPLTAQQELQARLNGRTTYNLHGHPATGRWTLGERHPEHMKARTHPVIATHTCPGPIPATAIPEPPPDASGEPDLFTPPEDIPF